MAGGHVVDDDQTADGDSLEDVVDLTYPSHSNRDGEKAEGSAFQQVVPGALDDVDVEVSQDLAGTGAHRRIRLVADDLGALAGPQTQPGSSGTGSCLAFPDGTVHSRSQGGHETAGLITGGGEIAHLQRIVEGLRHRFGNLGNG